MPKHYTLDWELFLAWSMRRGKMGSLPRRTQRFIFTPLTQPVPRSWNRPICLLSLGIKRLPDLDLFSHDLERLGALQNHPYILPHLKSQEAIKVYLWHMRAVLTAQPIARVSPGFWRRTELTEMSPSKPHTKTPQTNDLFFGTFSKKLG